MTEPKARRLAAIAAWINANMPGYKAEIEKGYCNTDFKPKGLRYITRKGKGRTGNRLMVYRPLTEQERAEGEKPHWLYGDRKLVLDHNAAETYRCNSEVESWLVEELKKLKRRSA